MQSNFLADSNISFYPHWVVFYCFPKHLQVWGSCFLHHADLSSSFFFSYLSVIFDLQVSILYLKATHLWRLNISLLHSIISTSYPEIDVVPHQIAKILFIGVHLEYKISIFQEKRRWESYKKKFLILNLKSTIFQACKKLFIVSPCQFSVLLSSRSFLQSKKWYIEVCKKFLQGESNLKLNSARFLMSHVL